MFVILSAPRHTHIHTRLLSAYQFSIKLDAVVLYSPDGRRVAYYSAYDDALGVKGVAWSPSSQFLAIGSYDQKVFRSVSTTNATATHISSASKAYVCLRG